MHPKDARDRDIEEQEPVVISNEEQTIGASVELDENVRRTAVYLPAQVADPLLRRGTSTVTVESPSDRDHM
ncbi:molybdopterin dinucleotide binding domain-containing protein [Natrinema sp. SYSU A 869]|uniref:molybdopterin dinucleotide binding domain-containing protein n=1 Tax=Natrinema sp. SYSU A 869 TaxID=2871694 RepID=UPI0021046935|nr:molybdopterin dinucleotide binding domain-containing protein [Natrinema sp. SYSU A 869]